MTTRKDIADFDFGGSATYRIVVQGVLDKNWHNRLGGMVVMTSSEKTHMPKTTLRGPIRDQAALHGLLETLYSLHLPILEVEKVDSPSDNGAAEIEPEV